MNAFFTFLILSAIFTVLLEILREIKAWRKQMNADFNLLATMIGESLSEKEHKE